MRQNSSTPARLNLAAGVTTIQTAGSAAAKEEIQLALDIEEGRAPGPRIVPSAPYITGPGGNAVMEQPASAEAAVAFVDTWTQAGAEWFKLYRHTTPDIARAVIDAAHRRGARVTAHPCTLTFGQLADMGIDRIEHGLLSMTDFHTPRSPNTCPPDRLSRLTELDLDSPPVQTLLTKLAARGVALTSTLAISESHFAHRPQGDARSLRTLSPERLEAYERRQQKLKEGTSTFTPALFRKILAFELAFVKSGGLLVAGPDTGRHVLPGFGDQRNFELLVEAGFEPAQAIRVMTSNGASALGLGDEIGTIAAGMEADMVVLNGDLAANPEVIRQVEYVFKSGRAFDPRSLLAEVDGLVGARSSSDAQRGCRFAPAARQDSSPATRAESAKPEAERLSVFTCGRSIPRPS